MNGRACLGTFLSCISKDLLQPHQIHEKKCALFLFVREVLRVRKGNAMDKFVAIMKSIGSALWAILKGIFKTVWILLKIVWWIFKYFVWWPVKIIFKIFSSVSSGVKVSSWDWRNGN